MHSFYSLHDNSSEFSVLGVGMDLEFQGWSDQGAVNKLTATTHSPVVLAKALLPVLTTTTPTIVRIR